MTWLETLAATTMRFEELGDYVVGKVTAEEPSFGDFGECVVLTVRVTEGRSDSDEIPRGSYVRVFCSSTYLRTFAENNAPLLNDYIVLTLTALRPPRRAGHNATKVIEGVRKRRTDVEEW